MKRQLFIIGLFMCALSGCSEFEEPIPVQEPESVAASSQTRALATTFTTLPDPYALANMQAVYNTFGGNRTLQATHKYVRFRPQNQEQLDRLEDTYELDLFEYPLDINIPEGVEYVDPSIPEGELGWFYVGVPANFVFPQDIPKEIIRDCYIPSDDEVINVPAGTRAGASGSYSVEELAYFNLGYVTTPLTRSGGGGGQYPGGHVYVTDDNGQNIPVKGIRVKINSWIKSHWTYTDNNGYFKSTTRFWQENLNCVLVFINPTHDFIFWRVANYQSGWHIPSFGRIKRKVDIDKTDADKEIILSEGGPQQWGRMYVAACEYYEMCAREGILTPPRDLKILVSPDAFAGFNSSCALMANRVNLGSGPGSLQRLLKDLVENVGGENWFIAGAAALYIDANGPDLIITPQNLNYRQIYNTMHHELSHASHHNKVGNGYWEGYIRYIVNSLIASDGDLSYGDGIGDYAGICQVGEMWGHAMGDIAMSEKFNENRLHAAYIDASQPFPYNFNHPEEDLVANGGGWIEPDPIWALITRGVLTKKQVFDCLTSDVDTVDKLINKLCVGKSISVADAIRTAFDHNDVPTITGNMPTALNTFLPFSVQAVNNLGADFTAFNGWTVNPSSGVTISNPNSPNTTIKFTSSGNYTLTANFTLSDNTNHAVTKVLTLAVPTPVISANKHTMTSQSTVTFTVNSPQPGATYEWEVNGIYLSENGSSITLPGSWAQMGDKGDNGGGGGLIILSDPIVAGPNAYQYGAIRASCRAHSNSGLSGWSTPVTVQIMQSAQN